MFLARNSYNPELKTQNSQLRTFPGLPAGDVFLAEEFCEVGPLKAKFFSCACLIPVISSQRLFEDLPTVRFHAFMVVTGG